MAAEICRLKDPRLAMGALQRRSAEMQLGRWDEVHNQILISQLFGQYGGRFCKTM